MNGLVDSRGPATFARKVRRQVPGAIPQFPQFAGRPGPVTGVVHRVTRRAFFAADAGRWTLSA
jgi:hypothetical protein